MVSSGTAAWEQRWHPLREEWVVLAAHRQDRPWQGERAAVSAARMPAYVETCYFCPRNPRVGGARNPDYRSVFVFDNDHPCVGADAPRSLEPPPGIYRNAPAAGIARVVCYTPKHNATLAELPVDQIADLLRTWRDQYLDLGARPEVRHVLTFENKGEVVGVSNPHPHGQIYATNFIFKTIETESAVSRRIFRNTAVPSLPTSSAPNRMMAVASCSKVRPRSFFCHISPDTRTSATSRPRKRTRAWPPWRRRSSTIWLRLSKSCWSDMTTCGACRFRTS